MLSTRLVVSWFPHGAARRFMSGGDRTQIYSEKRLVGYSAQQMFTVVSDVGHYRHFVPWCKKSEVIASKPKQWLRAELVIGFPPLIGESYTSTVQLFEPHLVTAVCQDLRLFEHLRTAWKFTDNQDNNTSILDFAVSFSFANAVHAYLSRMFFDEVVRQNVKAFLREAERRYGKQSIPKQKPIVYAKRA